MKALAAAVACAGVLVLAPAPPARADKEPPRAEKEPEADAAERAEGRKRFAAGEALFQRGDFAAALVEYDAGYRLTRLPGFLINIAHCHRLSGDLRKARAFYRKYLLVVPTSTRKAEVEEIIRKLDDAIADEDGAAARQDAEAAARDPKTPSRRWWLWSALASSVVGGTVATMALDAQEKSAAR